jgi:hypothetical protein
MLGVVGRALRRLDQGEELGEVVEGGNNQIGRMRLLVELLAKARARLKDHVIFAV